MKKVDLTKRKSLILSIAMSSLIVLSIGVSTFAYWQKEEGNFNIPTSGFNATEDEFTYYACIPNVATRNGYDYYDLDSIPADLTDRVTGLAAVRFEALTKTCYIPSYPDVTIDGVKYNNGDVQELPVIHVLNSLSYDDISIDNGFSKIETLIIPETVTFIQKGSFAKSENLKEVSFLGNSANSGYIWYDEDEFKRYDEDDIEIENAIELHFEGSHRHNASLLFTLKNPENYLYTQFNDEFEYDNMNKSYYSYVVPNVDIDQGSEIIEGVTSSKKMKANVKYKLSYDGTTLEIEEYTYKLNYAGLAEPIDLVLNTSVTYEEYIIPSLLNGVSTLNTIRIQNYPEIRVDEYIDGIINSNVVSTFELANLNASYSKDNYAFDIKYAPSYTYESIHYYTDSSDELIDVNTLTQISVEKAYFLNQVTSDTFDVEGEKVKTITVADNNYLSLYVRAKYKDSNNFTNTYFVDPRDPNGTNVYVEMSKNGDAWTYQFSSNNAPDIVKTEYVNDTEYLVPNSFVFYPGKYSVVSYPSYVANDVTEQTLQNTLASSSYGTTRVYLDTTLESGLYQDDHYGDDGKILYHWYLVYWDDNGKQGNFRVYYADFESTYLIADVPNTAHHFKFARIEAANNIDTALANEWKGVKNQNEFDGITFKKANESEKIRYLDTTNGYNLIKWKKWYENNNGHFVSTFNVDDTYKITDTKLLLRNRNYLVINNYGENGNERYIPLDENLGYDRKDIHSITNKLEFTKYSDYENRHIQSIALSEGAIIKAKIFNINSASYFDGYFGKSNVVGNSALGFLVQNKEGVAVETSEYFDFDANGYLVVKKDCQVEFFLKVNYDSSSKTIVDYGWYFKVISDTLPGFNREVVVDLDSEITGNTNSEGSEGYYSSSTKIFDMTYPLLEQTGTIYKLTRNYSNTEFEEYYYHRPSGQKILGNYVVSYYYETNRNFSGNTGSEYYGIISDSPTGEMIVGDENVILFSPIASKNYDEKYYAVFDEYDNLLTYLSYNQTQSVNEGYQCFSFVIPQALNDYENVYIYEVNKNGEIQNKENGPLNSETNLDDIRIMYNHINNTSITYDKNDLIYDYYLHIEGTYNKNNNNLGFSYAETDGDYKIYYFDNLLISSTSKYQVYQNITNIALSNDTNKLDEQIIDGYYYTGLTHENNNYQKFTLPDGYYDLSLRVNTTTGYVYLGYKYLGQEVSNNVDYYLYIYDAGVEVDVIKMNSTINTNNYFADVVVSKNYTYKIYDSLNMLVTGSEGTLTYSNKGINVARIYFSNNYPYIVDEVATKVYVQQMNGIELIYNFGNHPNTYKYVEDEVNKERYVNIRYSPVMYAPSDEKFINKIKSRTFTNAYLNILDGENVVSSQNFETTTETSYGSYIVVTDFDVDIQIKIGNEIINGDANGVSLTIPQPGKYYIYYHKTSSIITCTKVQDINRFYVTLNGQEIASLDVSESTSSYYEYVVKRHIILYEDIVLEGNDADVLQVVDNMGNVVSSIDRVTLNGDSVTTISSGVYSLTYSVDSYRRVDDKYLVFTYFNFNDIGSSTVTYHYQTAVDTNVTTDKKAVTTTNEIIWDYTLVSYKELSSYVPQGKYFAGWSLTENGTTIAHVDGKTITVTADTHLYAVYKDRSENHEILWLSDLKFDSTSDIVFTLSGLESSVITNVTHETVDTSNYIDIEDNRVYINPSLIERIGYVEGGIPLLVHLESTIDAETYSIVVKIPYPRYESNGMTSNSYSVDFSTSEYPTSSASSTKIGKIEALEDDQISWAVENANITTYNSRGSNAEPIDGTDLILRLKAGAASSIFGRATTDIMFTGLASISFDMMVQEYFDKASLYVVLLDANKHEIYRSNDIVNSADDTWETKNISIDVSGVYFVRFEVKSTALLDTFVHVDNLKLQGLVKKTTVSTTIEDYANANNWTNGTKYSSFDLDVNITVSTNDGGNTGKYYTDGNNWRIYQTENPTVVIVAKAGYEIVSVTITYTIDNTGVLVYESTNIASGEIVTLNTPSSSVQFGVDNTGEATNGQVRITAIEVVYQNT